MKKPPVLTDWGFLASPLRNNLTEQLYHPLTKQVEYANGDKAWYLNGELHRTDGPAVERTNGSKAWYLNDKRHRVDGPAEEWSNGNKEWWVKGKQHLID